MAAIKGSNMHQTEKAVKTESKKWYQKSGGIVALLILFWPVGLYLMWKYADWAKVAKIIVTVAIGLVFFMTIANMSDSQSTTPSQTENKSVEEMVPEKENKLQDSSQGTVDTQEEPKSDQPTETTSQRNAVKKAKSYLQIAGFSRDGLVAQLEYEQFSSEDAVYGADHTSADWNEQAAKKAKSYMDMSSFSRGSLIDQLLYEKFTQEQAEYGATAVGL